MLLSPIAFGPEPCTPLTIAFQSVCAQLAVNIEHTRYISLPLQFLMCRDKFTNSTCLDAGPRNPAIPLGGRDFACRFLFPPRGQPRPPPPDSRNWPRETDTDVRSPTPARQNSTSKNRTLPKHDPHPQTPAHIREPFVMHSGKSLTSNCLTQYDTERGAPGSLPRHAQ